MISENKRNLTEKEEYYKLITDEKSNHIGTNANGAGSQCVRRKNIGSLSFRERYLSLRKKEQSARVALFVYAIRVLTFFQSLRFMKAPLRVERESLSLRKIAQMGTCEVPIFFVSDDQRLISSLSVRAST